MQPQTLLWPFFPSILIKTHILKLLITYLKGKKALYFQTGNVVLPQRKLLDDRTLPRALGANNLPEWGMMCNKKG